MKVLGVIIVALVMLYVSACQPDANTAFKTGLKYYKGDGVTQDYTEALKWYRKATDDSHKGVHIFPY